MHSAIMVVIWAATYQGEEGSHAWHEVQRQNNEQDGAPLHRARKAPIESEGDVEGLALVVDSKGAELHHIADEPTYCVDKVGCKVTIWLLCIFLQGRPEHLSDTRQTDWPLQMLFRMQHHEMHNACMKLQIYVRLVLCSIQHIIRGSPSCLARDPGHAAHDRSLHEHQPCKASRTNLGHDGNCRTVAEDQEHGVHVELAQD